MKKKTRNILLITVGLFIGLFFFARNNFQEDKQILLELKVKSGDGDLKFVLDQFEGPNQFTNPNIFIAYYKWKQEIIARFVTNEEIIENTSGNKIVNDISNIYREYWRTQFLMENPENRTDSNLYHHIVDYLISNKLTTLSKDSLSKNIKDDSELTRIIKGEGFNTKFMYRNGFQEVMIWDKESVAKYIVTLPKDTIETSVVFIESYHLNGYDDYASFGSSTVGGWAIKDSATLYCNQGDYELTSEKFKVSYLKHETIHFTDLNEYPNLSSADLEYRAKLIELMHCTKNTIYDRVAQFASGADASNRNHAHPFANHRLITNLSELVFQSEYESDISKWNKIPVETLNKAATTLYNQSEATLQKNKSLAAVI